MLTLVRFAPVARYVGRERVITNASVVARAVFLVLPVSHIAGRAHSLHCSPDCGYAASVAVDPRGAAIARTLRERMASLDVLVRDADDETWARVCPGEGWAVGLVTYHIGLGLARQGGWIIDRVGGAPPLV